MAGDAGDVQPPSDRLDAVLEPNVPEPPDKSAPPIPSS